MTVTTGARGSASTCCAHPGRPAALPDRPAAATNALWPISSTRIIAVSWSSTWLMVHIWPSFISCLMTSDALTDILCASSATVMVSGTWTSLTIASVGAWKVLRGRRALPRRPRGPPRQPSRPLAAGVAAGLRTRVFLASSDQVDDTLADLIDFLSAGFLSARVRRAPSAALPRPACAACRCGGLGLAAATGRPGAAPARGAARSSWRLICATSSATALRALVGRWRARPPRRPPCSAAALALAFAWPRRRRLRFGLARRRPSGSAAARRRLAAWRASRPSSRGLRLLLSACGLLGISVSASAWPGVPAFHQVRFLASDQLGLTARLFLAARDFGFVDPARRGCGTGASAGASAVRMTRRAARRCASCDFDLDRARLAGGVRLLDLGGFLAGQRDLLLLGSTVPWVAQVVAVLIFLLRNGSTSTFSTPAERSCVSSKSAGIFSSVANWATLLLAIVVSCLHDRHAWPREPSSRAFNIRCFGVIGARARMAPNSSNARPAKASTVLIPACQLAGRCGPCLRGCPVSSMPSRPSSEAIASVTSASRARVRSSLTVSSSKIRFPAFRKSARRRFLRGWRSLPPPGCRPLPGRRPAFP